MCGRTLRKMELTKKLCAARATLQQHRDGIDVKQSTHAAEQADLVAQIADLDAAKRAATVKLLAMQKAHAGTVRELDAALARERVLTQQLQHQSRSQGEVEASLREQLQIAKESTAKVSFLLFTVTFHANHAHNLTRSP